MGHAGLASNPLPLAPSGPWERNSRPDLLVIGLEGTRTEVEAIALQPGPTDEDSLILLAGPDAPKLRDCKATIFGDGALGG